MLLIARTPTRFLNNPEHIQNTLTMYGRINKPTVGYYWVLTNTNDFKDRSITICQNFMNQAAIKYEKISAAQKGKLTGSEKTITK